MSQVNHPASCWTFVLLEVIGILFTVLRIVLRALCTLCKHPTTELLPQIDPSRFWQLGSHLAQAMYPSSSSQVVRFRT